MMVPRHAGCGRIAPVEHTRVRTLRIRSTLASPSTARAMARRVLVGWTADLLSLRRRGLQNPTWSGLQRASQAGGPPRPPRADIDLFDSP